MAKRHRMSRSILKPKSKFSFVPEEKLNEAVAAPSGEFSKALGLLKLNISMSNRLERDLIVSRMVKTGQKKLLKEWRALVKRRSVLKRVLKGEKKTKFSISNEIPDSRKEIEKQITELSKKIAEIVNGL